MLTVDKLNQYYGESHTLWDVELDVPAVRIRELRQLRDMHSADVVLDPCAFDLDGFGVASGR